LSELVEVRIPIYPEYWETCGSCGSGNIVVLEVHVCPGDIIRADDNILTLETGKVALDIPSPHGGSIIDVLVAEGDLVREAQVIVRMAAS
jgi:pyruvate/2-oxoglutarate dehydrogenase complex dihydrolipoamide acyltransferase (E2) component